MRSPPKPKTLFRLLRRNEEEGRRTEANKSKLIHKLTKPIISQKEFDCAIKNTTDEFGNAPLDFSFCNLSEITFRPDDTNITTFNKSCYIRAIIGEGPIKDLSSLSFNYANFQFADLSFVNFAEADLTRADLTDANLKGAVFRGGEFIWCKFKRGRFKIGGFKWGRFKVGRFKWGRFK